MKMNKKLFIVKIILIVSFLILIISGFGCDKRKANSDYVLDFLRRLANKSEDINIRQRSQLAISKWQDGVTEPEPILISATMKTVGVEEGEIMSLTLIIYDENSDFIGFVVEEESVDSNNVMTTQLVERYPVFTNLSYANYSEVLFQFIPVFIRDENQRKPEEQWLKYINTPLLQQKEEYKKRSKKNWTWKDTIPPVWLSIPDPKKLNIYIRVYDRTGNLSERIPLVYSQKKWPWEDENFL